jgi:peptidoglycan/LPS O-acetylase OafA/YrhL
MSETIETALFRTKGVGPGFDILRIALAVTILLGHAKWISGSSTGVHIVVESAVRNGVPLSEAVASYSEWDTWHILHRAYHIAQVPVFFALSGFLVSASAFRLKNVKTFLLFRWLRIFPALSVEVTLSALVLGPIFTTVSLANYFSDHLFVRYFGNVVGLVYFYLPATFTSNPAGSYVNLNLWTLPAEFYCYLITAMAMVLGLFYSRLVFSAAFAAATAFLIFASVSLDVGRTYEDVYPTSVVVYYFFAGVLLYQWKKHIPLDWRVFLVAGFIGALGLGLRAGAFFAPIFVCYATVFVGMLRIPPIPLIGRGDYSYGIYLYGFPICQAFVAGIPRLIGHPYWLILIAGATTVTLAVVSWHLIEHPFLSLKRKFEKRIFVGPDERARAELGPRAARQRSS